VKWTNGVQKFRKEVVGWSKLMQVQTQDFAERLITIAVEEL
jgi:hypothetical protein